jgi:ATP-dependent Clp protease protease subunit
MEQVMEKQIDIMDYKKEQAFYMKEIEWGVNSDTNTTWMNHEFEIDSVYSVQIKLDYLLRCNPEKSINMNITSYGGDVYAVLGLVDFMRSLPVKVNTHCIGTCMSAASVLLACGTGVRSMSTNSTVMVHEGSAFEAGKTTDVMKGVDHLKDLQKNINLILGEVSNKDASFWKKIQRNDTYLTAQMCLEYGIIDKIA